MQDAKRILLGATSGSSATVKSVRHLAMCLAVLAWAGPALGAKLHVPSVKCPTIQAAIDLAQGGDTVVLRDGIYTGAGNRDLDFQGKAITVCSQHGPEVCIIDCQGTETEPHRGFYFHSQEGLDSVVEGLTISNGYANAGGGIACENGSSPTVTNCTFRDNYAESWGGGLWDLDSNPTVTHCTFRDNDAHFYGGAMANAGGNPTVANCTFSGNSAGFHAGAMDNSESSPTVTNCVFTGNSATYVGGGIDFYFSSAVVTNCTFSGNSATSGGGMWDSWSSPTVINCTFSGNSADEGGAIYAASSPTVINCIFWSDSGGEIYNYSGDAAVTYSDVQGGFPGEGNIDADPLLDATGRLQVGSACIDAGNSAAVPDGVTTDLDGNPRIQRASVDMGAYESSYKVKRIKD